MAPPSLFLGTLLALLALGGAIPIDNGLEGDPEVQCSPGSIVVNFNTRNPFEGHVYAKGLYNDPNCRVDSTGGNSATIELPFGGCNVRRERSLAPLGVFVSATVIITFHPNFVTKVDRAITISCFYMEADKTVSQDLEVSMLTTAFLTQIAPMPTCNYDILDGGPTGTPVKYTVVGQPVYHKWTCNTDTQDTFCMVVHSCFVDDGQGDKVDLLDDQGCGIDRYLLRNLEYPTDLMAGQETHVFKFADRSQLFFQCQISITTKEPGTECPKPACPELARRRSRRSPIAVPQGDLIGTMDVSSFIESLDLEDSQSGPNPLAPAPANMGQRVIYEQSPAVQGGYCLSPAGLGLMVSVTGLSVAAVLVIGVLFLRKSSK